MLGFSADRPTKIKLIRLYFANHHIQINFYYCLTKYDTKILTFRLQKKHTSTSGDSNAREFREPLVGSTKYETASGLKKKKGYSNIYVINLTSLRPSPRTSTATPVPACLVESRATFKLNPGCPSISQHSVGASA